MHSPSDRCRIPPRRPASALFVPPDDGSAQDVVEQEALHNREDTPGRYHGMVDPIHGEPPSRDEL